jgi:hypothetical protein
MDNGFDSGRNGGDLYLVNNAFIRKMVYSIVKMAFILRG